MKIIKVLIGIRGCRPCNRLNHSPMRIGNWGSRISLQPLTEGRDRLNKQPIHSQCMLEFVLIW